MPTLDPIAAHRLLRAAEAKLIEAERLRDEARLTLDAALSEAGWRRLIGGFAPGAEALYTDATGEVHPLGAVLDQERAATR
jgi:hypothetical protein